MTQVGLWKLLSTRLRSLLQYHAFFDREKVLSGQRGTAGSSPGSTPGSE